MKKSYLLAFILPFIAAPVSAEKIYVDVGGSLVNFDDGVDTISPFNIFGRVGYKFHENVNIGAEASVTLVPDELLGVDLSVDIITVYLRGVLPLSQTASLFLQLGSSNTELTGEVGSISVSADDTDTSIGAGAEFSLNEKAYITISYTTYNNNDGVDVTGINAGIGARF